MSALEKQTLTETSRLKNILVTLEHFVEKLENKKITTTSGSPPEVANDGDGDVPNGASNGNEIK